MITRRRFLWRSTLGATFAGSPRPIEQTREDIRAPVPPSIAELRSMRGQVRPITVEERRARLDKARRLMAEHKLDAILLPGGTSLTYFAGARWGNSERLMAIVLPVRGDDFCVCPAFEEDRARTARTRTTEPNRYPNLAGRRKPIRTGRPRSERPRRQLRPARHRGNVQIRLQRQHCERGAGAALDACDTGHCRLPDDQRQPRGRAHAARFASNVEVLRSCLPRADAWHDGERGGRPATDKMKRVFDIVHQAQSVALKAARPGVPLESIDAAARTTIVNAGYGPAFKYFTHRLGHGIGMDGHEWPYLIRNNMFGWDKAVTLRH